MNIPLAHICRPVLTLIAVVAAVSLPLTARAENRAATSPEAADAVVMTIDSEPVATAEYTLIMRGRVSEVFNYFHEKSGLEDRLGYWKDDGQPENPVRKLRELVTNEFKQIKTVQRLAKQKGVTQDISYRGFQDRFSQENARRLKALEAKQVIYGPKQYTEERYYYFKQTDLATALQEALAKGPELAITDAEILAFYDSQKELVGDRPLVDLRPQIIALLQKQKYDALIADLIAKAKVEINTDVLNAIAPRHDP